MIQNVLAIIPARGGSKGVPNKNIIEVSGNPLISWTIDAAKKAKCITRLILSSDDSNIIKIASDFGCDTPFIRPDELARDNSSSTGVVLHALKQIPNFEYVMLLQPTSPLRTSQHIDEAFDLLLSSNADSCVSIAPLSKSINWMYYQNDNKKISPVVSVDQRETRRQDIQMPFVLNCAIYIMKTSNFIENKSFLTKNMVGYEMSTENSLDIDSYEDLETFKRLIGI
jgi:CMP-N,N'-diacetyllegionaminic acid synthase